MNSIARNRPGHESLTTCTEHGHKPFMPAGTLDGSRVPATYQTKEAHVELYAAIGVLLVVVLLVVVVGGIWKDRL